MDLGNLNWSVKADTSDLERAKDEMEQVRGSADNGRRATESLGHATEQAGRRSRTATDRMQRGFNDVSSSVQKNVRRLVQWGSLIAGLATGAAAMFIRSSLDAVDAQAKLARQLDSTIGGVRALQLASKDAGVSTGVINGAMERFSARLGEAKRGTGQTKEALDRLGLSASNLAGMDVDKRMAAMADRVQDLGMSGAETADLLRQFGIRNREIVNLMRQGGDAIRDARVEIEDYGLAIDNVDAATIEAANDAMSRAGLVVESLKNQLAVELAPVILTVAGDFNNSAREAGGFGESVITAAKQAIGAIVPLLDALDMAERALNLAAIGGQYAGTAIRWAMIDAAAWIAEGPIQAINSLISVMNKLPTVNIDQADQFGWVEGLRANATSAAGEMNSLSAAMKGVTNAPKPSERVNAFFERVDENAQKIADSVSKAGEETDDYTDNVNSNTDGVNDNTSSQEKNTGSRNKNTGAVKSASKAIEDHSKEVDSLRRSLDPAYARQQDFAEATATLDKGLMTGQLTLHQYTALWDTAAEKMTGAGDATEDLADKSANAADEMSREWERFGNAIDDTFADAFKGAFDSFDDFAGSIKDSFETLIAEMAYAAVKNEIKINLGMEGSGPMSGGLGSIGDQISGAFSAGSKIPGIGNLIGKAGSALGFGGSVAGASLGGMSGGLSSTAITSANAVAGGASTGLMGAMGSAMPWIGGGMMLDSVFDLGIGDAISDGLGKIKTGLFGGDWEMKDAGFNLGIEDGQIAGSQFERERKSGGLFSGASHRTKESDLSGDLQAGLQATLDAQDAALRGTVEALGLQEDAFEGFSTEITKISTKGMEEGEAQAAIQSWLTSTIRGGVESVADSAGLLGNVGDALARGFESLDDQQFIESAQKAMQLEHFGEQIGGSMRDDIFDHMHAVTESGAQDVRSSIDGLTDAMAGAQVLIDASERLNLQFDATAGGAIHAAFAMQDLAGGVENLGQLQSSYYQNFFSEAERAAHLQDDLTASMQQMGLQLPETRDGFRELVEAQDLNTQAGRKNYAQLLQLSGSFAELEGAASGADGAVQGASNAMREREGLERELMRVQGDTAGLREQELQELDPSNRALQERIWEIESEQEASKASAEAARESARAQEEARRATEQAIKAAKDQVRQAYQRFDNQAFDLQISYLDLLGDGEEALTRQRERELDAIDESLHPFQRRLWALEDEAAAQERAKEAGQQYAQELGSIQDQLSKTFGGINEWIDKRNATSGTPGQNLDETGEQFAEQLKAAQAGDRSALESITQYADAYLGAGETMFASGSEFQKLQADVISKLEDLPEQISAEEFLAQEIRDALHDTVGELPGGIAGALSPMFDSIDLDANGLIDWDEFYGAFQGLASDEQLKGIYNQLDANGDGQISELEALNKSTAGTQENTEDGGKTIAERAGEQLSSLDSLAGATADNVDALIGLDLSMNSLASAIDDLIKAQRSGGGGSSGSGSSGVSDVAKDSGARDDATKWVKQYRDSISGADAQQDREGNRMSSTFLKNMWRMDPGKLSGANAELGQALAELEKIGAAIPADEVDVGDLSKSHSFFAKGGAFTNGIVHEPTLFDMGEMGEAGSEAIMPLERGPGGVLGVHAWSAPTMLSGNDVRDVLTDMRQELQALRRENSDLQSRIADNTGGTAGAVMQGNQQAARQRDTQIQEQRRQTRAQRIKERN